MIYFSRNIIYLLLAYQANEMLAQTLLTKQPANVCSRTTNGRGVGTVFVSRCNSDEEINGAICYPQCKSNYESFGCCICRKKGCGGLPFAESLDGASCIKPAAYGRGIGYPWKIDDTLNDVAMFRRCEADHGVGKCEKWGAVVYPKCKPGFAPFGCCLCSPICPTNYKDIGAFCLKPIYGRGAGVSRLGCPDGKVNDAGLCYPACKANETGVGPICWQNCPQELNFSCGIFCTRNERQCAKTTTALVTASAVLDSAAVTGGARIANVAGGVRIAAVAGGVGIAVATTTAVIASLIGLTKNFEFVTTCPVN